MHCDLAVGSTVAANLCRQRRNVVQVEKMTLYKQRTLTFDANYVLYNN